MPKPPRKHRPIDTVDAEHVLDMTEGRGWQLYSQRLEHTLRTKIDDLVHDQPEMKTAHIRGYLEALQLALKLPGILIKEAKERKK